MALGHEQCEPVVRVMLDQVEVTGRVPVTEVARPAAQERVEVLHDVFNRQQQPLPCGDLTNAVAGVCIALREGQRARNWTCLARFARTHR